jgi:predicted RNA binding protein YcfA (HicA-like mRNA interferase family)
VKRKHRRTLEAIYNVQTNIDWKNIEALFIELGAEIRERAGSRVRFRFPDGTRAVFHEPHPSNETGRATVREIMNLLKRMGVRP